MMLFHIALRASPNGRWRAGDIEDCAAPDACGCLADGRAWSAFYADSDLRGVKR